MSNNDTIELQKEKYATLKKCADAKSAKFI